MIVTRVKEWLPPRLKQGLRDSYYHLLEFRQGLQEKETLSPPLHAKGYVGDGDFEKIGNAFVTYFQQKAGLKPSDRVLDIGCGIGRMAIPLTRVLKAGGSYDGFDVFPYGIGWCKRRISTRHPQFRFHWFDLANTAYNRKGRLDPAYFQFPFEAESFDFAFATSVFTHLTRPTTENYLRETSRCLKSGGRLVASFFLLDEDFGLKAQAGQTKFQFNYEVDGCYVNDPNIIEGIVGYKKTAILSLLEKYGLKVPSPIEFGSWAGGNNGVSSQDILIAIKS